MLMLAISLVLSMYAVDVAEQPHNISDSPSQFTTLSMFGVSVSGLSGRRHLHA